MADSSLVDRIVADLERQIRDGRLVPGERLPSERRLCMVFGVGRTTVRESLKVLAVRGLVVTTPRGAIVADGSAQHNQGDELARLAARASVRDLYEVRKMIEVPAARWAALRATKTDIQRLRRTIEAALTAAVRAANPNVTFHTALIAATHNPVLIKVFDANHDLFFRLSSYWKFFDEGAVQEIRARRHESAREWHVRILEAIEQSDPDEAAGAMFQHLDIMEKDLLSRLRTERGSVSRRSPASESIDAG